jgi:hypothetical protein
VCASLRASRVAELLETSGCVRPGEVVAEPFRRCLLGPIE